MSGQAPKRPPKKSQIKPKTWLATRSLEEAKGGGGGGSRTRVRERPLYDDYVRICFVFLSRELKNQQDAHDPARLFSAFRSEQKPGPIPPYDAIRSPCEPKDRGGYLKIKQRKQTACCWQLLFSDRFTGAQNPARLHTMTRTRRSRFAPTLVQSHCTTS